MKNFIAKPCQKLNSRWDVFLDYLDGNPDLKAIWQPCPTFLWVFPLVFHPGRMPEIPAVKLRRENQILFLPEDKDPRSWVGVENFISRIFPFLGGQNSRFFCSLGYFGPSLAFRISLSRKKKKQHFVFGKEKHDLFIRCPFFAEG